MLHVSVENMPETLTYAVLGAIGFDLLIALLLAVHGDPLGMVLALVIAICGYWVLCREPLVVVGARAVAAGAAALLLLCGLLELAARWPYYALLLFIGAGAFGFVYLLLRQGGIAAELRVGGVIVIGEPGRAGLARMLEELYEAGVLTAEEVAAKRAQHGL